MAEVKWIKLNTDMFDNAKIKYLRTLPEGDKIVLIWVMLLAKAGKCNSNGFIFLTENIPYTAEMLSAEFDFEITTIQLALGSLNKLGMINLDESNLCITGWEEHQNIEGLDKIREQTRKRVAKCRERQKLITTNVTSNVKVTPSNETDKEREEEREEEKNKENIVATKVTIDSLICSYSTNLHLVQALKDFVDMRKANKKVMSVKAMQMLLTKLNKLATTDEDKITILENSIMNSWVGIFKLKGQVVTNNKTNVESRANGGAYEYFT